MSLNDVSLSVEEVEEALNEIENKYSLVKYSKRKDSFENAVTVLSKEFDSVGLPTIDLSQSLMNITKQIASSALSLVHIYRKTLSQMKDLNVESKCKDTQTTDLYKIIDEYKLKLRKCEDKNYVLQNTVDKLRCDNKDILKKEDVMKDELEKNKRYHLSKQSDLQHLIKKLTMENQRLREMLGKDLNTHVTRDDVTLQLIKKYKSNEEVFKNTIQKLQENNKYLLNEIIDLKMDESCKNKEDTRT